MGAVGQRAYDVGHLGVGYVGNVLPLSSLPGAGPLPVVGIEGASHVRLRGYSSPSSDSSVVSCSVPATARSAASSIGGSAFPRFAARRRIPAQALFDKKNLEGIDPGASSTDDNEHTTASLGHAEVLSVEDPPGGGTRGSKHATCVRPPGPCWL